MWANKIRNYIRCNYGSYLYIHEMSHVQGNLVRPLIVLCGMKGAGKDTVADYLSKYEYHKTSIANPMKQMCKYVFDLSEEQVNGSQKEVLDSRYNKTPRSIMQSFGTDLMQFDIQKYIPTVGRKVWINKLMQSLDYDRNDCKMNVVVTDVRFVHEYETIKAAHSDCVLVRVDNPLCVSDSHVSENEWKQLRPDVILYNNGTDYKDLYRDIDTMMYNIDLDNGSESEKK